MPAAWLLLIAEGRVDPSSTLPNPLPRPPSRPAVERPATSPPANDLGERVRSLRLPQLPEENWSLRRIASWLLIGAVVIAAGWYGFKVIANRAASVAEPAAAGADSAAESPSRPTATTSTANVNPTVGGEGPALQAKGYIIAAHQILVSPKVSGMVLELDIEEGRRVEKGDILARLESTDYEADSNRAKAAVRLAAAKLLELKNGPRSQELAQARAQLAEAQAQVKQLQLQYGRDKQLVGSDTVTQQQFEETESKFRAMEQQAERLSSALKLMEEGTRIEQIQQAEAELDQAEAAAEKAAWQLGNCTITAPIKGTILKKNAEEGNLVNPIAFNGSFSLCDLADLSDLEVELFVQERDIAAVFKGQICKINAEAYADRTYSGYVSRLMPIADRAKGAIPVRVKVKVPAEEEGIYLKPEMGAIVTFLKGKPDGENSSVPPVDESNRPTTPPAAAEEGLPTSSPTNPDNKQ